MVGGQGRGSALPTGRSGKGSAGVCGGRVSQAGGRWGGESVIILLAIAAVHIFRLEAWWEVALAWVKYALEGGSRTASSVELDVATQSVGEVAIENELLRARCRNVAHFGPVELEPMSTTTSAAAGRRYGRKAYGEAPPSSYYARPSGAHTPTPALPRVGGRLILWEEGFHDVGESRRLPAGVSLAHGRAGPYRSDTGGAESPV